MARSKIEIVDADQTLANGLTANFPLKTAFLLANKTLTVADIVKLLNKRIAARVKTANAKGAYAAAVLAEQEIETQVAPVRKGLQHQLQARYGEGSTKLAEFSFGGTKRKKPTSATKAQAAKQAQATRAARGTVGRTKKKLIKGVVPTDGGVSASAGGGQAAAASAVGAKGAPSVGT